MTRFFLVVAMAALAFVPGAHAQQQPVWVQIEAQPTLSEAQEAARGYARELQDVNGFTLGSGYYAIALGPYGEQDARQVLRVLRAEGVIPGDSYIARSRDYRRQFWPVGANLLDRPVAAVPETDTADGSRTQELPDPPLETRREARASERLLTRDERFELQTALKWAGFYDGAIDAAFGRGTRAAMRRWQQDNGYKGTGILTTRQRAELLEQYNAVLDGLGLRTVRDDDAGIAIRLPTEVVAFDRYAPPFAHYTATGDIDARVLLISQRGDENTLAGLYDIMQTLEIVPRAGPRTLDGDTFTLIGEGPLFVSHTQAWLKQGEIKGFTLVWPAGDEERRTRLLGAMQESFTRLDGALDPTAGSGEEQSVDLVAGLDVRKPRLSRSGFYVDRAGTVVTTADAVQGCARITIEEEYEARVAAEDSAAGIAVLRPVQALAPLSIAAFQQAVPRLRSEVAVAGYSYGGVLGAPTLTFGQLADLRDLDGDESRKRLELAALEGDAGGPVLDAGGAVLGMLLPETRDKRRLPEDVSLAADAAVVQEVLAQAGISPAATSQVGQVSPEALTEQAKGMTVLVSCWD
ncbi:serine protease [Roseovarius sp. SYSU LYC5161]|uniref:serine protease n=1 Tax=Roseovarius halophilus (ex Wu et al. 2025) TaxID=3376060 RepID=UPI00399A4EBB